MTENEVKELQRALNRFTKKFLRDVPPLDDDGVKGTLTNRRIMTVKFYLGYGENRDGSVKPLFRRRMAHPHSPRFSTPQMLATGAARRRKQRALAGQPLPSEGVSHFDGKPVASWMIPHLQESRRNGWRGSVFSGFRTPERSEQICREMCGQPTCPGRCGGKNSNHSKVREPEGAIDVTDHENFGRIQKKIGSPLKNNLPADRPHYSASGH